MKQHVLVIGAGWSGLACSLALLDAGLRVTLVDAAPQVGGRARRVDVLLGDREFALDNGQHLLIGAYREYLALARRIGLDPSQLFQSQPFALRYPDGFTIAAREAPAPWHLAGALFFARGVGWRDRVAAAAWVSRWRRRRWSLSDDSAAVALFADHPALLIERLWQPLCLAALNVRLEDASAQIFLRVLRDSLDADAQASRFLVARRDLSELFAEPALRVLRAGGVQVRLRDPVRALERSVGPQPSWRIPLRSGAVDADAVVLALPPTRSAELLLSAKHPEAAAPARALARIQSAPIATVYLRYPAGTRLDHAVYALREAPESSEHAQWVFDRGRLQGENDGVLSVVISGHGRHRELAADQLAASVARQLARGFALPEPIATEVLVEKRATIVPSPGLVRPGTRVGVRGLYLAGDSADSPYPSTLEGSVRSGLAAARAVVEDAVLSAP